jgi:hypothetical protein
VDERTGEPPLAGRFSILRLLYCYQDVKSTKTERPSMHDLLRIIGWFVLFVVVSVVLWLSPIGKFIEEFEEFREWKRKQGK